MIIKRINISNYKTYLSLDLDLSVDEERPIILIGGMNGGGKTTLFEAICGALYGLNINTKEEFEELLNNGAVGSVTPEIKLEVTFVGVVLNQEQRYVLRRSYKLNPNDKPVESVYLNMNGNVFTYGTATPALQRAQSEQQVNKIIKANLPQELSKYFLFDAMQSSELLKKNVFAQIIKDNIENVMGFKKYLQLKRAAEHAQQERAQQRLEAEQEYKEYERLCAEKREKEEQLASVEAKEDLICRYLIDSKEDYERAKSGVETSTQLKSKIATLDDKINDTIKRATDYNESLKTFIEDIESTVFLPKLLSNNMAELGNIIKTKEELKREGDAVYSFDMLKDVTSKIVAYLREMGLCEDVVDENNVVNYVIALQNQNRPIDPYAFLDESEVDRFNYLLNNAQANPFLALDQLRTSINSQIESLDSWEMQRESLRRSFTGGNEDLVRAYQGKERELQQLKDDKAKLQKEIERLKTNIHRIDIQIQQEPDVKYDTLMKLKPFFEEVASTLLKKKKARIETEMQQQLNELLISYKGHVARVELSETLENFSIKMYHTAGNQISLSQLNAASKQIFIQVLLKVLRGLGDYNPPVMIDTVMGVLDNESRDALMEEYFPQLAEQTILLCTTSEIRMNEDYHKLEPFISRTYTLVRDVESQSTYVEDGYFGVTLNA
jgi:DNA sulfur modification protein DndD